MKRWLISGTVLILILSLILLFLKPNNKDLFSDYYDIDNNIFETVNENDIKNMIDNNINGIIFIGNKEDKETANFVYETLNDNKIGLAYFSIKEYQNKYITDLVGYSFSYPALIGIGDKKIIEIVDNIDKDSIIELIDKVYKNTICNEDC